MLTPVALAARPRARAPEAASAVAVAVAVPAAARPAVLVAPPPPRPPPPPSKAELRQLYPLVAWDREQPKGDIPMAQVPRGGVDLGWVHGKRVRATGEQLSGALERMKQNQVLGTAQVMQHNDAVRQRWQAAAEKALQHGRRAPPEPRLLPLPPLKPVTIASWD